jgi:HEAT repeat protein
MRAAMAGRADVLADAVAHGSPPRTAVLSMLLEHDSPIVRHAVVVALGHSTEPESEQILVSLLSDSERALRLHAYDALCAKPRPVIMRSPHALCSFRLGACLRLRWRLRLLRSSAAPGHE